MNLSLRYSFIGRFYSKAMATNLVRFPYILELQKLKIVQINLVRRNLDGLNLFPDAEIAQYIPTVLNLKGALLDDFDNTFTRIAGGSPPNFPFATAHDCEFPRIFLFSKVTDDPCFRLQVGFKPQRRIQNTCTLPGDKCGR